MPLILIRQVTPGREYRVSKAKLIQMFLDANGLSINDLQSFSYDSASDELVFVMKDVSAPLTVNYSSANLTAP